MFTHQPFLTTPQGTRRFACSAVAVQAIILNADERVLLLSSPTKNHPGEWQIISGALEAAETVLAGVLREVREEAGPHIQGRPLGVVHAQTFHFDVQVPYMIGIYYLLAYEGGQVQPGDDMYDSQFRWWRLEELVQEKVKLFVPPQLWVLQRAIELYRLWKEQGQIDIDLNL